MRTFVDEKGMEATVQRVKDQMRVYPWTERNNPCNSTPAVGSVYAYAERDSEGRNHLRILGDGSLETF